MVHSWMDATGASHSYNCCILLLRGVSSWEQKITLAKNNPSHRNICQSPSRQNIIRVQCRRVNRMVSRTRYKARGRCCIFAFRYFQRPNTNHLWRRQRKSIEAATKGDTVNSSQRREKPSKIHAWLSAPEPPTNQTKATKERQNDIGLWFAEGEYFAKWKMHAASRIWLYGIPGCGKTILTSTVIQNLIQCRSKDSSSVTAYFVFDFNDIPK